MAPCGHTTYKMVLVTQRYVFAKEQPRLTREIYMSFTVTAGRTDLKQSGLKDDCTPYHLRMLMDWDHPESHWRCWSSQSVQYKLGVAQWHDIGVANTRCYGAGQRRIRRCPVRYSKTWLGGVEQREPELEMGQMSVVYKVDHVQSKIRQAI